MFFLAIRFNDSHIDFTMEFHSNFIKSFPFIDIFCTEFLNSILKDLTRANF